MPLSAIVVGIDVGTSGVRAVAAAPDGRVLAGASCPLSSSRTPLGTHEQDPAGWWAALASAARQVSNAGHALGVAVTSTSGTLVVTGDNGDPLLPAIMYDDGRAGPQAAALAALDNGPWNASYSLAKALWVREHEPAVWRRARRLLHPADWIVGRLVGAFCVSDYSNALKLGYDAARGAWNPAVEAAGLSSMLPPRVVAPGHRAGVVRQAAAADTGLPEGTPVFAGATDGIACLIASGARDPGDASTTLGTTLVWKALSPTRPAAAPGVYCHFHPSGLQAPGAASNTGPGAVQSAPAVDIAELDRACAAHLPTRVLCYLLRCSGERFPFCRPDASPFREGVPSDALEWHAAQLQSVAFVERWGYEVLENCGVALGERVFSTGAASRSPVLCALRANVLRRTILRCSEPGAAFGAAIIAAAGAFFDGHFRAAISAMTRVEAEYAADAVLAAPYEAIYGSFREACRTRGFGA